MTLSKSHTPPGQGRHQTCFSNCHFDFIIHLRFWKILPQTTESGLVPFLELSTRPCPVQAGGELNSANGFYNQLAKQPHFKWCVDARCLMARIPPRSIEPFKPWADALMGGRSRVSGVPRPVMSTKSATKHPSSNWLVDPSSRFHRSCHVGRRVVKGRSTHKNCLLLCPALNDMAGWQADSKFSGGGLLLECLRSRVLHQDQSRSGPRNCYASSLMP